VTEDVILDDISRVRAILRWVHELGVHVAFDDFGTGYGALAGDRLRTCLVVRAAFTGACCSPVGCEDAGVPAAADGRANPVSRRWPESPSPDHGQRPVASSATAFPCPAPRREAMIGSISPSRDDKLCRNNGGRRLVSASSNDGEDHWILEISIVLTCASAFSFYLADTHQGS